MAYAIRRAGRKFWGSLHAFKFTFQRVVSRFRGFDQGPENCTGRFVLVHGAFGMPLHCEHEVIGSSPLQGFDNAVVDAVGRNPQATADRVSRLVMRRIHRQHDLAGTLLDDAWGGRYSKPSID